ncbi:uncharacterized protein LOC135171445 isoform X2 [Diachasmimorpha longicaudata]|uniref:uncharacterized protein LOC135171445 isoform X2 n=1 Tax=Diachasmimorpha longicaudata TaxID=58733 RepID=UPI0030B8FB82
MLIKSRKTQIPKKMEKQDDIIDNEGENVNFADKRNSTKCDGVNSEVDSDIEDSPALWDRKLSVDKVQFREYVGSESATSSVGGNEGEPRAGKALEAPKNDEQLVHLNNALQISNSSTQDKPSNDVIEITDPLEHEVACHGNSSTGNETNLFEEKSSRNMAVKIRKLATDHIGHIYLQVIIDILTIFTSEGYKNLPKTASQLLGFNHRVDSKSIISCPF